MAVTQNLLDKTLRWYIFLATLILLIASPVFYFVTRQMYIHEANEHLKLRKKEFIRYHLPSLHQTDIALWNRYNRDEKILDRKGGSRKEKLRTVFYFDSLAHDYEPYRELNTPITIEGRPYVFSAKINLIEKEDLLQGTGLLFFVLITTMLIGLYFITKVLSIKLWKPFYIGLEHLEKFEVDKSASTRLSQTTINEFVRLNQVIENLIRKNTSIYNTQKEFIENAAHELQTPLAVIQGKLETLFQQSSLTQSQSEVLEKLNDAVARLSRLNKNLLLLSRIEHDQFSESENISVNDLLKKHYEFFSEQAAAKKIRITVESSPSVNVTANPVLTEVMINNLFLNAIRHNIEGGYISIQLKETGFAISNTGHHSALPEQKIFSRFSKINPSTQGSGLGLAIVKKIADLNRWEIRYAFKNNWHTFSVNFR
ncbi:MAG: HAMP domain-containing histidine kinase [Bacteroidetes bacterium]|nr:HAMP domain-containing histidine kinase [Bacteroidota bacterium]